jgi:starch synthase
MADSYDVVLTLHNLAHQGILDPSAINGWGLDDEAFSLDSMEFYGRANILKGAALSCDAITTVSPHYSWDIQTSEGGCGLHGVFSSLRSRLVGILNGIDYDVWSPVTDKSLPANYDKNNPAGKAICRRKLFELCDWTDDGRPVLLFVGRLVQQKGIDIMLSMLEWQLADRCRAVVIGSGMQQYESWTEYLRRTHPGAFWCFTGFDEDVAHLAYAGADILMMPSLFEPCGLSQMIAMSYGTIPVVRNTGGLADTVIDFDGSPDGTGFIFSDYSADELSRAVNRAIAAYDDKQRWREVMKNAMSADFSWDSATRTYIDLYDGLKNGDYLG